MDNADVSRSMLSRDLKNLIKKGVVVKRLNNVGRVEYAKK